MFKLTNDRSDDTLLEMGSGFRYGTLHDNKLDIQNTRRTNMFNDTIDISQSWPFDYLQPLIFYRYVFTSG